MKKILTPLIIFIIIAACDDSPSGPDTYTLDNYKILKDQTHNVIMPLADSNHWEYQVLKSSCHDDDCYITIYDYPDTLRGKYFFLGSNIGFLSCSGYLSSNTDEGLLLLDSNMKQFFKYPIKVGDTYDVEISFKVPYLYYFSENDSTAVVATDSILFRYTLISNNEEITTDVGSFSTYAYKVESFMVFPEGSDCQTELAWDTFYYFAPGIGLIKYQTYKYNYKTSEYTILEKLILKEYTLN